MDGNLIIELIGRKTADYLNTSHNAGRLGNYVKAAEAQASAQVLMDLQRDIKAITDESKAAAITSVIKQIVTPPAAKPTGKPTGKPKITKPSRDVGTGKDWSLDESLRPGDIDKILGEGSAAKGKEYRCSDDPQKVKYSWAFEVDGKHCAIWDYKGTRWSGYGPKECFQALGIKVVG